MFISLSVCTILWLSISLSVHPFLLAGTLNSTESCQAPDDCGEKSNRLCFEEQCLCPMGTIWNDSRLFCETAPCNTDTDCLPWPHSTCGELSRRCTCSAGFTLDPFHVECQMNGAALTLIILGSITGTMLFCFFCAICWCCVVCYGLPHTTVDTTEMTTTVILAKGKADPPLPKKKGTSQTGKLVSGKAGSNVSVEKITGKSCLPSKNALAN